MIKIREDGKEYFVRAEWTNSYQDQRDRDIYYDVELRAYDNEKYTGEDFVLESYIVSTRTGKVYEDYENIEPRSIPLRKCINYANGRHFGPDLSKTLCEYAEWYYMQKRGIENSKKKHFWGGQEKPGHLKNIKEWQITTGDTLEDMLESLFISIAIKTGLTEVEHTVDYMTMAKKILPAVMETARKGGIPVWDPEADSYTF